MAKRTVVYSGKSKKVVDSDSKKSESTEKKTSSEKK